MCNLAKTVPEEELHCHTKVFLEVVDASFSAQRMFQNLMQLGNLKHKLWKFIWENCCFDVELMCTENLVNLLKVTAFFKLRFEGLR
jgi:hypothetical protein